MPSAATAVRDFAQAQQTQQAISVLSAQNTISVLRTLNRNGGGLPVSAFTDAMPWMGAKLAPRLTAMEGNGLITRARSGRASVVTLTAAGREALDIQKPFTRWASAHQSVPEAGTGLGAYTEQALASLNRVYTVSTVWALATEGEPAYPSEIQDMALPEGMHPSALYARLSQLEDTGLVERSGEPRNYMYELTAAGRELTTPLETLARWSQHHMPAPTADAPAAAARRAATASAAVPAAAPRAVPSQVSAPAPAQPSPSEQATRAQAAGLRSTTSSLVFSHQGAPQPAPIIANPAAARHR